MNEHTLKRVLQYMRSAKLVEFYQCPLEDFDPSAGPCINKRGTKGTKTLKHSMIVCVHSLPMYLMYLYHIFDTEKENINKYVVCIITKNLYNACYLTHNFNGTYSYVCFFVVRMKILFFSLVNH